MVSVPFAPCMRPMWPRFPNVLLHARKLAIFGQSRGPETLRAKTLKGPQVFIPLAEPLLASPSHPDP
eukprot:5887007-Pyramimonas_sp.AAC.1